MRMTFKTSGPFKPPGKDEIAVKAIKKTRNEIEEWVREKYEVAINNGRHLKEL